MTHNDVFHTKVHQHTGGNFAVNAPLFSKCTFSAPTWILVPRHSSTALHRLVNGVQITTSQPAFFTAGTSSPMRAAASGGGFVHFPVAGDDSLALCLVH